MGKIQNGGFALEFIVSVLKEIKALVRSYVHEMKLGKFQLTQFWQDQKCRGPRTF